MAVLALLPLAGLPAVAQAKWGTPFQFAKPGTLDVVAPVLAVSGSGAGRCRLRHPGRRHARRLGGLCHPAPGARRHAPAIRSRFSGSAQILAAAYDGGSLELLTGAAPA